MVRKSPKYIQETSDADVEVIVGERYYVNWITGEWYPAEIIEQRVSRQDENSDSFLEYYVHYLGFDRRLDEWVARERIDPESTVDDIPEEEHNSMRARKTKRKYDETIFEARGLSEGPVNLEKEYEEITKVKNIQMVELGGYEIDTWYFSPFPDEYCSEEKLYICEFCLKYMKKPRTMVYHQQNCGAQSPPGKEIYNDGNLTMFEVDGKDFKIYCQNLCLLSKLFLDHKTLYYDVAPFLFYVLCELRPMGDTKTSGKRHHIVGYFSKEKVSVENYNLACILTFPPYQRKGYGKFLISVSYELTKREDTTGSPEKPLSDLGKISYRSYWAYVIIQMLLLDVENVTIQDIAKATGIRAEDILSTLHSLNLLKYWKGQHVISITREVIDNFKQQSKKIRLCDCKYLRWSPPQDKTNAVLRRTSIV